MTKLTDAQLKLLGELPKRVVDSYKPAQRLVELGLAEWKDTPIPYGTNFLERTPKGNKELEERIKGMSK